MSLPSGHYEQGFNAGLEYKARLEKLKWP